MQCLLGMVAWFGLAFSVAALWSYVLGLFIVSLAIRIPNPF